MNGNVFPGAGTDSIIISLELQDLKKMKVSRSPTSIIPYKTILPLYLVRILHLVKIQSLN